MTMGTAGGRRHASIAVLDDVLIWMSATVLFSMMMLTAVDVFMRYVLGSPIRGSFEVSEILMAVLIFSALPLVSRHDEHVRVELGQHLVGLRLLSWVSAFAHLVCTLVLLAAARFIWLRAPRVVEYGDVTAVLRVPIWPFIYFMAILLFLTALIHAAKFISEVRGRP